MLSSVDLLDVVFTALDPVYKRVGCLEYVDDSGRPHYEYACTIGCKTCVHGCCRMAAIRAAGFTGIADKLEANAEAKDWAGNWGKMVYEKAKHGRDPKRRKLMAEMILSMRRKALKYGDACVAGAWAGALIGS